MSNIDVKVNVASKTLNKLISVLNRAFGAEHDPARIVTEAEANAKAKTITTEADAQALIRLAQAQSTVDVIRAETEIDIRDMRDRAEVQFVQRMQRRIDAKEKRRQRNIESISAKAVLALPENQGKVTESLPDEDWVDQFFDHCQDVSNEQMQMLWARLLAGEVSRPGSYAPRTLWTLKNFTKEDAKMFHLFCAYTWEKVNGTFIPIVGVRYVETAELTREFQVHLRFLGLINILREKDHSDRVNDERSTRYPYVHREPPTPVHVNFREGDSLCLGYHGNWYKIYPDINNFNTLPLGKLQFTPTGRELCTLVEPECDLDYRNRVIKQWKALKFIIKHARNRQK